MIFSRKSPATVQLHEWMKQANTVVRPGTNSKVLQQWQEQITGILATAPDLDARFQGKRPMAWAMANMPLGQVLLQALLDQPPTRDCSIDDVIEVACKTSHNEHVAKSLASVIAWAPNIPTPTGKKSPPLYAKVIRLNPQVPVVVLEKLYRAGHDPATPDEKGRTAVHLAIVNRINTDAQDWIFSRCDLEKVNSIGNTALSTALSIHSFGCAHRLLEFGADPTHPSVLKSLEIEESRIPRSMIPSMRKLEAVIRARCSEKSMEVGTAMPQAHRSAMKRF